MYRRTKLLCDSWHSWGLVIWNDNINIKQNKSVDKILTSRRQPQNDV